MVESPVAGAIGIDELGCHRAVVDSESLMYIANSVQCDSVATAGRAPVARHDIPALAMRVISRSNGIVPT